MTHQLSESGRILRRLGEAVVAHRASLAKAAEGEPEASIADLETILKRAAALEALAIFDGGSSAPAAVLSNGHKWLLAKVEKDLLMEKEETKSLVIDMCPRLRVPYLHLRMLIGDYHRAGENRRTAADMEVGRKSRRHLL